MAAKPPPPVSRTAVNANLMIVLRPKSDLDERYILLIESPQARARNELYLEFPKGAFDASGYFTGPMMDDLRQETNFKLSKDHLINLTAVVQKTQPSTCEPGSHIEPAVRSIRANPNTTVLLWEKYMDRKEIEAFKGRFAGRRAPNEASNIRMLEYEDFCERSTRTMELEHGRSIYECLVICGILEQYLREKRIGK
ncbi:hypothetical protein BKA58DRAFT_378498 [Alternaria rosae]|uniref:uncharacterized protein n=1 Tax=Alternaria rosae TaxID=1187941 RepID=UPI001E8CF134|nr:uncharacterized protein BKA58DRAFT_378498 [Alternaria rosae]KAH6879034.1 hypothetical protein BKA58DRAFT_378498 [Alternaria rosae]